MLKNSLVSPAQPRRAETRRGWAGEKSEFFEHPAESWPVVRDMRTIEIQADLYRFSSTS